MASSIDAEIQHSFMLKTRIEGKCLNLQIFSRGNVEIFPTWRPLSPYLFNIVLKVSSIQNDWGGGSNEALITVCGNFQIIRINK